MNNLPAFISIFFGATTLLTVWLFYNAASKSKPVLFFLLTLLILQGILGSSGFYQVTASFPPRFVLMPAPGILTIVILSCTKKGRAFIDSLNVRKLTLLHIIRIPVEITLYYLFLEKLIPQLMTFEGMNYDILSGISAALLYYLVFIKRWVNQSALLAWNFAGLALLINIVVIAILCAQTPFQQFAFDQPNVGVTIFPFVWLPAIIVPIVLMAHLAAIRQLMRVKS